MDPHTSLDDDRIAGYGRPTGSEPDDPGWAEREPDASSGDLVAIASDLVETQLHVRPIPTLLVALAAGWIVGRILR